MATKRFVRRGVSKFYFLPSVADLAAGPTRIELDAGADLTPEIADVAGWMLENASAATPDMSSTFEKSIPGLDSAADSSFTFYEPEDVPEGDGDVDVDVLLVKGTEGFVVILRRGDKPASPSMDTFPTRVKSKGAEYSATNDPARTVASFSITEEPSLDKPVPAAAA